MRNHAQCILNVCIAILRDMHSYFKFHFTQTVSRSDNDDKVFYSKNADNELEKIKNASSKCQ